ncbi:hypothetical protein FJT64_023449 [Amphibalanus amphitrite]|uniref:Uncharacterized protein n=1 Tax=Amphibalanus amphitrite TaxID=1232801 RepID=A0A6A4WHW2_AMPAM|nr:hypothetical protein FJT64_023449 [Amphibalanus amphitrite]
MCKFNLFDAISTSLVAEAKKTPVDPVMIAILVSLVLMFLIICIVLQLFSNRVAAQFACAADRLKMEPERCSPLVRGWDGASYARYLTVPPAAGSSSRRPSVLDSIPGSPQSRRCSLAAPEVGSPPGRRGSLRDAGRRRSSLGRRRSLTPAERWRLQAVHRSGLLRPRHYHMSCDLWSSDDESVLGAPAPAPSGRSPAQARRHRLGALQVVPAALEPSPAALEPSQ